MARMAARLLSERPLDLSVAFGANFPEFESRLDRIETGVQLVQRKFDRTLGKVKGDQ